MAGSEGGHDTGMPSRSNDKYTNVTAIEMANLMRKFGNNAQIRARLWDQAMLAFNLSDEGVPISSLLLTGMGGHSYTAQC